MEKIEEFFKTSPGLFGYVFIGLGILLIIGSIRNWNWLFEGGDGKVFNMTWFIGMFGRKAAKVLYVIVGLIFIVLGVVWLLLYSSLVGAV